MEQEMTKPFKTVTIEYFEDFGVVGTFGRSIDYDTTDVDRQKSRRIRVVTTTEEYCGSHHDPAVIKVYSYL